MMKQTDIAIAGAGPSAMLLAAEVAETGLSAIIIAPEPQETWPNQYACWRDELPDRPGMDWDELITPSFPSAQIWLDDRSPLVLERQYGRLEGSKLQRALWQRFESAGGRARSGRVNQVNYDARGAELRLVDGEDLRATVFVDATGHGARFIQRRQGKTSGYQVAYGVLADLKGEPAPSDRMTLMDYRGITPGDDISNPSFLYAFQRESGLWFLEETVLVGPNKTGFETLRKRLERRLGSMGVSVNRVFEEERCLIPMNPPLPRMDQPGLGYGGAASMVHPASGYMVAYAAGRAPRVASCLAHGLGRSGSDPRQVVREAWDVIWPRSDRQSHALYRLGSNILAEFSVEETREFFRAFFEQPKSRWRGYHSRSLDVRGVMASMWGTFGQLRPEIRKAMFAAIARNPREAWEAIRGGLPE
jgi:lycopene beta-cyclase